MEKEALTTEKYQEICDNIHQFSCIAFTLILARDVGILDTLIEADKSMTSKEIADSKGLKERYTQELLACLVSANLVNISMNESKIHVYYLEEPAKTVLGDDTNKAHMALPLVMKSSYKNVKECLPCDGPMGVGYSDELLRFIDELDKTDMSIDILEKVPELKTRLEKGIKVLELGSGLGSSIGRLASKYPKSIFTASEMSNEQEKLLKSRLGHLPNVRVTVFDLAVLPECPQERFDWIFMKNVSHVLPFPDESQKGIRRLVAEPDGLFTFIDFFGEGDPVKSIGDAREAATYAFSLFCCIPSSLHQSENSKAYGCCWSKETGIKITENANFSVETFALWKRQILFVARPV